MSLSILTIVIHMVDLDPLNSKQLSWYSVGSLLLLSSSVIFMMYWIQCGVICCSTGSNRQMVMIMVLSIVASAASVVLGIGGAYNSKQMYEIGKHGMMHTKIAGYKATKSQEMNYITNKSFNYEMFWIQIVIAFLHAGFSMALFWMTYRQTCKVQKRK